MQREMLSKGRTPMTTEERRGRTITLAIAAVLLLPNALAWVAVLALKLPIPRSGLWVGLAFSGGLSAFLALGFWWARAYSTYSLAAAAIYAVGSPLLGLRLVELVLSLPFAAVYAVAAWLLWSNRNIELYFDSRRSKDKYLSLSGTDSE